MVCQAPQTLSASLEVRHDNNHSHLSLSMIMKIKNELRC